MATVDLQLPPEVVEKIAELEQELAEGKGRTSLAGPYRLFSNQLALLSASVKPGDCTGPPQVVENGCRGVVRV